MWGQAGQAGPWELASEDCSHSLIPVTFWIPVFSQVSNLWHHGLGGSCCQTAPAVGTEISETVSQNELLLP